MITIQNPRRIALLALGALVVAAGVWLAPRWLHRGVKAVVIPTTVIDRRDIAQTVEATGTVQPIEIVEIKSKASGEILRMPVEIGSVVRAGDLLAQIDTVTVQNQYAQSLAALRAAQANVEVTTAQKKRSDELYSREAITADEHESATLGYANALSSLARAHSDLEIARLARADANVRAPSAGTVIEQDVTKGQVIASATSSASGGTTLLKMADLNRIQMQALVGETDIGSVWAGQPATVTVDAFPQHRFRGRVIKIEPQAQVQQSVTMFPVLIAIENENGLLLPGMNGEVTISIERRDQVIAVPLDAVRTMRELSSVAVALGMNADTLRAVVQRQMAERRGGTGRDSAGGAGTRVASAGGNGRRPGGSALGDAGGATGGGSATDPAGSAGGMRRRGGAGADGGWRRGQGRGGWGAGARSGSAMAGGVAMSDSARHAAVGVGGAQTQVAFLKTATGFEPRVVRIGVSDYDYAEVLDGLKEGDEVALLSVAEVQAKRQEDIDRVRQRMGSGLPGTAGGGTGGGTRGTGGSGGARGGGR